MIDVKSLRIGNWIIGSTDGIGIPNQIQQVFALEEKYINPVYDHQGGEYYIKPEDATGIELTEEILLKCGFEKESDNDKYGKVYLIPNTVFIIRRVNFSEKPFASMDYGYALEISSKDSWETVVKRIHSLHQIQNLYYALTGTELSIDLSS